MSVSVQVMVFSGRPDPRFELPDELVEDLTARLAQVLGVEEVAAPPDVGLGYRGMRVENSGGHEGIPTEFAVFQGVLTEGAGEEARHWRDAGSVEQFLIDAARQSELGDLVSQIGLGGEVA